ncbi:MAG: hypothetical protein RLZZ595_2027 [Bacteroidota bacterium]
MKAILFSILCLFTSFLFAQESKYLATKNANGIYIEHKVQPKENWYSVGRTYFISPKDIASFNGLTMEKGLSIGQLIKVPLTNVNFSQTSSASSGTPVYHLVQQKEGLLKVASNYGLELSEIKNLNGLKNEQINVGNYLVIGYLAASASGIATPAVAKTTTPIVEQTPKQDLVVPVTNKPDTKTVSASNAKTGVNTPVSNVSTKAEPKAQSVPEKPKDEIVKPVVKAVEQPAQPKSQNTAVKPASNYFAAGFEQQAKEGKEQKLENPSFGIFKSSSGWQDGKYYMLMNDVLPGTIVRVTAMGSSKTIHAKVLGAVPPGKESEGLVVRLSNAAAAVLGVETSGTISLSWFK